MSSGTSTARSRVPGNQAPSKGEAPSPAFSRILTRTSIPPRNPVSGAVRVIVVISARPPLVAQAAVHDPDGNLGPTPAVSGSGGGGRVAVPRPVVTIRTRPSTNTAVLSRAPAPGPALIVRRVRRTGGPPAGSRRERASGGGQGGP